MIPAPKKCANSADTAQKEPQDAHWIGSHRPGDGNELRHVQTPLPAFIFGDERLVLAKPLGELLLADAGFAAFGRQQLHQREMLG